MMATGPKPDKLWADAVRRAVMRETTLIDPDGSKRKAQYIHVIAGRLVKAAEDGDMSAIKEIGDRLDGKPMQAIEASGNLTVTIAAKDADLG